MLDGKDTPIEELIRNLRDKQALAKLIGSAPAFARAIQHLSEVARSGAAVLITGETGTGKELVARAIHYLSERDAYPFIAVNCGAFPETLLEVELFGHERGAFTDAHARRVGLIAQANGGTLFLDEVDTLPPKAQIGLLRVLQDKCYRVVGSSLEQCADVRIVSAGNVPLLQLAQSNSFRLDLYHRLAVFCIHLPPLRERREDIGPLAEHFLKKHALPDRECPQLSASALADLLSRQWLGNVRELENAVLRGIHLCRSNTIEPEDLRLAPCVQAPQEAGQASVGRQESYRAIKREVIEAFERDYLTRLMSEHRGNVSRAARTAGKERRDLGRLLKKHRLDPKAFQTARPPDS